VIARLSPVLREGFPLWKDLIPVPFNILSRICFLSSILDVSSRWCAQPPFPPLMLVLRWNSRLFPCLLCFLWSAAGSFNVSPLILPSGQLCFSFFLFGQGSYVFFSLDAGSRGIFRDIIPVPVRVLQMRCFFSLLQNTLKALLCCFFCLPISPHVSGIRWS